jgi:hypothetical protein
MLIAFALLALGWAQVFGIMRGYLCDCHGIAQSAPLIIVMVITTSAAMTMNRHRTRMTIMMRTRVRRMSTSL